MKGVRTGGRGRVRGLSESVKKEKFVTKTFLSDKLNKFPKLVKNYIC